MEQWKNINGYNGDYQISNLGRIKSFKKSYEKILKLNVKDSNGYKYVDLCKDCLKTRFKIHRLVAIHFLPKVEHKLCVNHKDGIKTNNKVENLEWCDYSENAIHAFKTGLRSHKNKFKSVAKMIDNKVIQVYDNITEVKNDNFNSGCVSQCCHKKRKSHRGYQWAFI